MSNPTTILEQVRRADNLPSIPAVALEILRLAENPDATLKEMASAIEKDPAVTAKILKLVNSPLFGVSKKISSLDQAVGLLGRRTIKIMALSFSVVDVVRETDMDGFDIEAFWRRSLTTAVSARLIGQTMHQALAEEAFVGGLLADIGMVAAWICAPDDYHPVIQESSDSTKSITEIEADRLGVTHAGLSSELLQSWGLPEDLGRAIAAHHGEGLADLEGIVGQLAQAIRTAAVIADLFCRQIPADELDRVRAECLSECGIDQPDLEDLLEQLDEHVKQTASLLELDVGDTISYADLRSKAALQIAQISMQAEDQVDESVRKEHEAREELSELRVKAATDGLTGVWNRAAILEFLERELARSAREGYPVAVIVADLDHFKRVNDTHGHPAGDVVLREAAQRMLSSVRRYDAVGRYGGEEFMMILTNCHESRAMMIAERTRANIATEPIFASDKLIQVTTSLGVSVCNDAKEVSPKLLIETADKALYRAKESGRNRIELGRLAALSETEATSRQPSLSIAKS